MQEFWLIRNSNQFFNDLDWLRIKQNPWGHQSIMHGTWIILEHWSSENFYQILIRFGSYWNTDRPEISTRFLSDLQPERECFCYRTRLLTARGITLRYWYMKEVMVQAVNQLSLHYGETDLVPLRTCSQKTHIVGVILWYLIVNCA